MSFGNAGVMYTPTSFLTPWMRCLSISSMMTARSFFSCSLRASLRYMYTVMNGAWPFVVMSVTTWYWIVCTPRTISSLTRFSTISDFFAGSIAAPTNDSSSSTSCVIFSRLTCTNGARCVSEMDCPPYWLDATCAMICVAMLHAVENECGRSIVVPLITVPFCSMSSRFTRSQLCIRCA